MRQTEPMLIVPECSAPKCHHSADHYTMIKCRSCGAWYCEEHMGVSRDGAESSLSERVAEAPAIRRMDLGLTGIAFNLGYCMACLDAGSARPPVNSA